MKRRGNETAKTAVLAGVVAMVGCLYLVAILNAVPPHPDLAVYVRGARDLLAGRPLYDAYLQSSADPALRNGFIYPPLFAILLAPLAWLPSNATAGVWLIVTQLALLLSFVLVMRRLAARRTVVLLALAITLTLYPLWADGSQAQANLPILLLVTAGILGVASGSNRAGGWLGLAAVLKLTPGLLLIWLLWDRRWRAAAWMAGVGAAVTAVAALLRPTDTLTYATRVLPLLAHGTAYYSNQSIAGLAARLFSHNPYVDPVAIFPWWPVAVDLVAAALLALWLVASRRLESPLARGLAFLPLLPLVSAISWEHHLVILLPLVWLLIVKLVQAPSPRELVGAVVTFGFAILCLLEIPHFPLGPPYATQFARAAHTANPLLIAAANRLLLGTLLLFVTAPWLLRQSSANSGVELKWPGTSSSSELDLPA